MKSSCTNTEFGDWLDHQKISQSFVLLQFFYGIRAVTRFWSFLINQSSSTVMGDNSNNNINTGTSVNVSNSRNGGNTINFNHPYYLHPSDSPGMTLISAVFYGRGYPGLTRSILIALSAKKKPGFINGSCKVPDLDATNYEQWACCNDIVISWILNSLAKDIGDSVIYSKTTKGI